MKECWNCLNKSRVCDYDKLVKADCLSQNKSMWKYDPNKPSMTFETAKQMIFDCAVELIYHKDGAKDKDIGNKLLSIIHEMDKMKIT